MARTTITEIKEKRKRIGITQIELARHSSVERSKLSRAESGRRFLSDHELENLEDALLLIWRRKAAAAQQVLSG
jgi:transcriptional regulator with XRE-family HTH domain